MKEDKQRMWDVVGGFIGQAGRWQPASMAPPDYTAAGAVTFGQRLAAANTKMLAKQTLGPRVTDMLSQEVAITTANLARHIRGAELTVKTLGLEIQKLPATIPSKPEAAWVDPKTNTANKDCTDTLMYLDKMINTATGMRQELFQLGRLRDKKKDSRTAAPPGQDKDKVGKRRVSTAPADAPKSKKKPRGVGLRARP